MQGGRDGLSFVPVSARLFPDRLDSGAFKLCGCSELLIVSLFFKSFEPRSGGFLRKISGELELFFFFPIWYGNQKYLFDLELASQHIYKYQGIKKKYPIVTHENKKKKLFNIHGFKKERSE